MSALDELKNRDWHIKSDTALESCILYSDKQGFSVDAEQAADELKELRAALDMANFIIDNLIAGFPNSAKSMAIDYRMWQLKEVKQ